MLDLIIIKCYSYQREEIRPLNVSQKQKGGERMFDEQLLRSKVVLNKMTLKTLSSAIGITESTMQRKLKDGSFNRVEISKIAEVLHLSGNDIIEIFFAKKLNYN